jgi:hypothetical protein
MGGGGTGGKKRSANFQPLVTQVASSLSEKPKIALVGCVTLSLTHPIASNGAHASDANTAYNESVWQEIIFRRQAASYSFLVLRVWSWGLGDFICVLTPNSQLDRSKRN